MCELSTDGEEGGMKKCQVSLVNMREWKKNSPRQCMRSVVELLAEF